MASPSAPDVGTAVCDLCWTGTGASRAQGHLSPQTIWLTVCPDPA